MVNLIVPCGKLPISSKAEIGGGPLPRRDKGR
jgi:hypothetical protein